jgi:3-oxoacyl-[acyl-carrier-protein] synthase-3
MAEVRTRLTRRTGDMTSRVRAAVYGSGSYVPQQVLTNAKLAEMVDTSNDWIVDRTGILERRIAGEDEATSTMAIQAGLAACQDADFDPQELDLILVATVTPDHQFPSTACLVQSALCAENAACLDLSAACSGFIYGLSCASAYLISNMYRNVLLIGADTMSRCVNFEDRRTCVLFGDGAAAVLMKPARNGSGMLHCCLGADGTQGDLVKLPMGGSREPVHAEGLAQGRQYVHLEGPAVYRFASRKLVELVQRVVSESRLSMSDISLVVPHQMNLRILESAMQRIDIPEDRWYVNLQRYGNTSAASVPLALDEARRQGRIQSGDLVVVVGLGAGLTWGAAVLKM